MVNPPPLPGLRGVRFAMERLGATHPACRTDRARPVCEARHEDQMLETCCSPTTMNGRCVCGMREPLAIRGGLSLSLLDTGVSPIERAALPGNLLSARGVGEPAQKIAVAGERRAKAHEIMSAQFIERA